MEKKEREEIKKNINSDIDALKESIEELKNENTLDNNYFPDDDSIPGLGLNFESYDYEKDISIIKDEAEETLECISSLYLDDGSMLNKNINKLIKNDAEEISDIKFSLSCAKRGLINCMRQLDAGSTDPDMHNAVNAYQKEIRESNKMIHDLLNKMKIFYKDLRDELKVKDINAGESLIDNNDEDDLRLIDKSEFSNIIEEYKKDPTFLKKFGS